MAPKLAGRWAWWNQYSRLSTERCVERAKAARLDGMIIKYGYPEVERAFTEAGIPWATERYVYPRQPETEATMLADAVDAGAVAAVINAEVEWEPLGLEPMLRLIDSFLTRHPEVELYASTDTRGERLNLPYQRVLGRHIAGWLPMVYPLAFRPTRPRGYVAAAMRDSLDNRDFGGIPVLPTIQTYDSIGPEAVREQLAEVARRGLGGYQAYTIRHATDNEWAEIVASAPEEEDMAYQTPEQRRLTLAMHAQLAVQSRQFGDPMDKLLEPVPDDLWAAGWAYIGVADPPPQPELVEGAYTTALTVTAVPERVPWDRGRGR